MFKFSDRALAQKSSAIREILKITESEEVISFAGGLPSATSFPIEKIKEAFNEVMNGDEAIGALQYSATEGFMPLRQWVADRINQREKTEFTTDNVLIVTGSQQALDLIGKALINPNTKILIETPTYLGGLQTFNQYAPSFESIASDDQGLDPDKLSDELAKSAGFLYSIPNFQNPTGRRLSSERRQALAKKAIANDLLLIEDDPYGELDYLGQRLPSLISYAPDNTVYLGSFSKILSPGMRLGYVVGPADVIKKLVQFKQSSDLHTPSLTQHIAYHVVKDGYLDVHIPKIRQLYQTRCQFMLSQLEKTMPDCVKWTRPEGGMFLWLELPSHFDTTELLKEAIQRNVAFVPGESFFANHPKKNCLRLAFVTVSEDKIESGIQTLAQLISEKL